MAVLSHLESKRRCVLEADHLVGRSPRSALRLDQSYVSAQHASLRWTGERWEVKDLGSRNGTFLDGARLQAGMDYPLSAGMTLCFGHADQAWTLEDASPPGVMVIAPDGAEAILAHDDLLALPSSDDPRVVLYRAPDGQWLLERPDEPVSKIEDQGSFEVDGKVWRFCWPRVLATTLLSERADELRLIKLHFSVSRDEEHVSLTASSRSRQLDLGSRAHHYLLLTLARRRLGDAAQGVPDTACGWVYQDELVDGLHITPAQLNVEIFRIRQQFSTLKLADAVTVIERRPRAKQLRIGVSDLVVDVL